MMVEKARYGMDAPRVVRGLLISSSVAIALFALSFLIVNHFWFWCAFMVTLLAALSLLVALGWMVLSFLWMKPKIAQQLMDDLALKGDELLLDVGCGRGLLLIEAAKRLPRGQACGVDIWTHDQSGNAMQATLNNAQAEDVHITLHTADIRFLPYPDNHFDAVVSSLVIHNVPSQEGREQALSEILRVLKPSGRFAIFDFHYGRKYIDFLSRKTHLTTQKRMLTYCPPAYLIMGQKA